MEQDKEKIGQKDTSAPTTQSQRAPPLITIIDQGRSEEDKEENKTPKEKRRGVNTNIGEFSYYRDSY